MAVRRKIFSIEQGAHARTRSGLSVAVDDAAQRYDEYVADLKALRSMMDPRAAIDRETIERSRAQVAEAHAYKSELALIHEAIRRTRGEIDPLVSLHLSEVKDAARELQAIVNGTEQATQKVLQAAEDIDQTANTLSAALKSGHELGLANDIRDRVVQIFEACNFQDLTGQRVGKVAEVLAFLDEHVSRLMEIWRGIEQSKPVALDAPLADDRRFLNGPKLAGENGHSTQKDIDLLFDIN